MSFEDMKSKPLAEVMRPTSLKDVFGQQHLLGEDQFLKSLHKNKQIVSMILWGPPGSGKTTLARIIAQNVDARFVEVSAAIQGIADIKKVIEDAKVHQRLGEKTVLFVDEIHRFNKAQQDAFLPHVESGLIILIGATTENPSFEVITPLLSRCRVIVLEALSDKDVALIIKKAAKQVGLSLKASSISALAKSAGGDARFALGTIEALRFAGKEVSEATLLDAIKRTHIAYDKSGEGHYNTASAYIKSMRGSDIDASLFYLGRMLEAGEDPCFIARRLLIFASEDIGEAWNGGLTLALNVYQAVERLGMPEAGYALTHGTIMLAKAPKDRKVAEALKNLKNAASEHADKQVPLHIRNATTGLMKDLGYGKDYKWKAGYEHKKGFLPEAIKNLKLY